MQIEIPDNSKKFFLLPLLALVLFLAMHESRSEQNGQQQVDVQESILKKDLAAEYLQQFTPQARNLLSREVFDAEFDGVLSAELVTELLGMKESGLVSIQDLMIRLLPLASQYSLPPISNFRVGALSQGETGALYLGANLEIEGAALGFAVHAEQSAVNNALLHGEPGILRIAVTAAPCGHCRQFLNELDSGNDLEIIVIGHSPVSLSQLLPDSFGPADLGLKNALLSTSSPSLQCKLDMEDMTACTGAKTAQHSYAPYSKSPSSITLKVKDDIFAGAYIENAAFNPSLSPLLSALDRMRFRQTNFSIIEDVVLFEQANANISQASYTKAILGEIAPSARFRVSIMEKLEDR